MLVFDNAQKSDREMRQRILTEMLAIDKACASRHVTVGNDTTFTIERTVSRKGYRHSMPTFDDKDAARYGQPMTRISVVFEMPDDTTPGLKGLVRDVREIEIKGLRKAAEDKLQAAKDRAAAAASEVERLRKGLEDLGIVDKQ